MLVWLFFTPAVAVHHIDIQMARLYRAPLSANHHTLFTP